MPKHILIVDDCEDVRFLLSLKLNNLGYKISESNNSASALNFLKKRFIFDVDLILFDITLEDISSNHLVSTINYIKKNYPAQIICISTHIDEEIIERFTKAGASEVLRKPIKTGQLNEYIKKVA